MFTSKSIDFGFVFVFLHHQSHSNLLEVEILEKKILRKNKIFTINYANATHY